MKARTFRMALVALAAAFLTSCGLLGGGEDSKVKVNPQLLPGRWEAPSQARNAAADAKLIFVFQTEDCVVGDVVYGKWGYQLDQGDNEPEDWAAAEAQLLDQSAEGDYHKNGWFGYDVENDGEIQFFHMTSVGDAVTPYTAKVTAFSAESMTLIEAGKTYVLKKVK